jgi:hypothetical protein
MALAAAIEIGAGRTPTPSREIVPGGESGAGRAGAGVQGSLPPIAREAASFRAGWQTLLASLGSSMESDAPTEANQGHSSASTSPLAAGADLRQEQEIKKGCSETEAANLSTANAERRSISMRPTAGTAHTVATKTVEKKSTAKPESASVRSSLPVPAIQTAHSNGAAAGPSPDLLLVLPQSVPEAVISNTAAPATVVETHAKQSEPSASLSTGFASASFHSPRLDAEDSGEFAGVANRTAGVTAKESGQLAKQGQASLAPNRDEFSGTTVGAATSPNAIENAPSSATIRTQGETASETPALERQPTPPLADLQTQTQTLVPNQSLTQSLAPGQNPAKPQVLGQNSSQTLSQGQSEIPTQAGSPGLRAVAASTDHDELNPLPMTTGTVAPPSGELSAVAPIVSQLGTAGEKGSASLPLRSVRASSNSGLAEHGSRLIKGQPSAAADASTMAREPAGAGEVTSKTGVLATASTAEKTGPDSRDTFATLDTEAASGKPTWIHASAQRAEAGYHDPILGWVGVRAGASGSGVHAEVVAGSADAAQALGSHMAGLNAYLAEHHLPVGTLTLTSPESRWIGMGNDRGAGDGMQQGAGQSTGQETAQGTPAGAQSRPSLDSSTQSPAALPELSAFSEGKERGAQTAGPGNIHISVMA